jgi:GNAT superfamily N-acetyltransferase
MHHNEEVLKSLCTREYNHANRLGRLPGKRINWMQKDELRDLFTREMRIDYQPLDSRKEVVGNIIRFVANDNRRGFVIYSNLSAETADRVIDEQIEYYQNLGVRFEWKLFDYDQPADLMERLKARGFEIEDAEALLVLDLQTNDPILDLPVSTDIRRITNPAGVDSVVAMLEQVWQSSHAEVGDMLRQSLRDTPDTISIYAAYAAGELVSAAWIHFAEGTSFASLWGGSTLPEHRRKGYYTQLLAVRAQEAARRGYRCLYVDASPMSRPVLEKHGFLLLGFSNPCMYYPTSR